jgi:hypothetical protein
VVILGLTWESRSLYDNDQLLEVVLQ